MRRRDRHTRVKGGREPTWRRVFVALTLFVFAYAGYTTQTHLHAPALAQSFSGENSHGKTPLQDDPQHCPFCQEYLLAGAYVVPAPIVLPLPVAVPSLTWIAQRDLPSLVTFAHAWQSRAPPNI